MWKDNSNETASPRVFIHCHTPAIFDRGMEARRANQGVVCALLFATAIEALSHDLVAFYEEIKRFPIIYHDEDHPANNYLTGAEREILEGLLKAEKDRKSVSKKLDIIRRRAHPNGMTNANFELLILTRNRIAHLEREATSLDANGDTSGGRPEVLTQLSAKGLTRELKHDEGWIESLETTEFCEWCESTARAVIQETLAKLPDTQNSSVFAGMFQNH